MAAGEDQTQAIVPHGSVVLGLLAEMKQRRLSMAIGARRFTPQAVDRAIAGGHDDPARRARGQAGLRPALCRGGEGVLNRVLGEVDVAESADQDRHRPTVLLAEHARDIRIGDPRPQSSASSWKGRTSIGTWQARVALRPHSSAASRSGALITQKPPMCSLPSANGPSVVSTSSPSSCTTVAVLEGCNPPANTHAPAERSW